MKYLALGIALWDSWMSGRLYCNGDIWWGALFATFAIFFAVISLKEAK